MRDGIPIDPDVVFIIESEELLSGELRVVVGDGVLDSKVMDDVEEEQHGLLGLDRGDRSSLCPLFKLVYDDKQVRIFAEHPLERSDQIEPLDRKRPRDGGSFGVLGPASGSTERSIDTLHSCAQSVQHRLL